MKTVKVRIALEINPDGQWHAYGYDNPKDWDECMEGLEPLDGHHVKRIWIEADVVVPSEDAEVVAGKAVEVELA